jgi:hypothetical protein
MPSSPNSPRPITEFARHHPDNFHDDPEFRTLAEIKVRRLNAAWTMVKKMMGES